MRLTFSIFFILINLVYSYSAVYRVGATRTYKTPNALYKANIIKDGDVIEIDFGIYSGNDALAIWSKDNITVKGVGGRPHMVAADKNVQGKSIWITTGNNIIIDNIEFSGCRVPDKNGAGIRVESLNLTIKNCYFHNNENGILTYNNPDSNLTVESTEFYDNGRSKSGGYAHNLYVGRINKFIFKHSYSHHCKIGHNLKSRAKENIILYSRIMDEETGNSSRLIDLPDGGFTIIMGNILMQGVNAPNGNLIGYCVEGCVNPNKELYIINNTLVNKRGSGLFFDIRKGTALVQNNILAGKGSLSNGKANKNFKNNLQEVNVADLKFVDEVKYNYRLKSGSKAIDLGEIVNSVKGYSLTPTESYKHPMKFSRRKISGTIDVGAYEYNINVTEEEPTKEPEDVNQISIYPNPVTHFLTIKNRTDINKVKIFNLAGKSIKEMDILDNRLDISGINNGVFLFSFYADEKLLENKKIVILKNK